MKHQTNTKPTRSQYKCMSLRSSCASCGVHVTKQASNCSRNPVGSRKVPLFLWINVIRGLMEISSHHGSSQPRSLPGQRF